MEKRKVFISYKYADENVCQLNGKINVSVHNYVEHIGEIFDKQNIAINKGEQNDEDLSHLSEEQIWERLKDNIYDSSITLLVISPNMKKENCAEKEQWIPRELSYSLSEICRNERHSFSNAILAVQLPDKKGSYDYETLPFDIMKKNKDYFYITTWSEFCRNPADALTKSELQKTFCKQRPHPTIT